MCAAVHAYAQSGDTTNSAAGILAFAVAPSGIDPDTGEVYKPKDFAAINQSGSFIVCDWYDNKKFALVINSKDSDTEEVLVKTNTKNSITLKSEIGLSQTTGEVRDVVKIECPVNTGGGTTNSITIGSQRVSDGNSGNQAATFVKGDSGRLCFGYAGTGTTRFYGIDNSTSVETLSYTIDKNGKMTIEDATIGIHSGNLEVNGAITTSGSGAKFVSNLVADNSQNRTNNWNFQFEGSTGVQLRATRPTGAVDATTSTLQIRVGGTDNGKRVVTFNPDLSSDFAGNISTPGDISAGTINGSFSLRMQPDDPAAYQASYSTDEDGQQVEAQTYVGTTEDLLDIITDLRARVAALEAG